MSVCVLEDRYIGILFSVNQTAVLLLVFRFNALKFQSASILPRQVRQNPREVLVSVWESPRLLE